jgi:heat shock protein HtpX
MDWSPDRGLLARMVLAGAFLLVGYLGLAVLLFPFDLPVALAVAGVLTVTLLGFVAFGDVVALWAVRGARAGPDDWLPGVRATVDRLAAAADVPAPALAVTADDEPNAFTAGVGDRRVLCVTTGLLRTLDGEELESVLAHELAHVKHRDAVVMTVAAFPLTVALILVSLGWGILIETDGDKRGGGVVVLLAGLGLLGASLPPVVVFSRYREFAADRGAVALTGNPGALAAALRRLDGWTGTPRRDARTVATLSAFCVVPVHRGLPLPSFHPSTERRVERLRALERDLET